MQHVFISYMHENTDVVDRLCEELTSCGIKVWLDRNDIKPGARWKDAIRNAIREGAFFIACFSKEYNRRSKTDKTYMNEELTIAIEELRQRPTDRVWFIPVKLNKCEIPDRSIGGGETLKEDLQHVKLYQNWDTGIQRIVKVIQSELPDPTIDEKVSKREIDQKAYAEFAKGLACQNSITETTSPEERWKKIQEVFYHYSKALEIEPNYVDALNARGSVYIFMDKFEKAIQDFNAVLRLDPHYFAAYLNRGTAYKTKGEYEQALKDFDQVIELNQDNFYAYASLGEIYKIKGDFAQSIKNYSTAIGFKSDYAEAYLSRGLVYASKGVLEKAIQDYNTAIKLNPHYGTYNNRGIAYANKDELEKAMQDYNTAIKLNPEFALVYYNRGDVWLRLREWEKAKADLMTAKKLGVDIIALFHNDYESIADFEQKTGIQLPPDIAELLTPQ